jgi:hypothetical protein
MLTRFFAATAAAHGARLDRQRREWAANMRASHLKLNPILKRRAASRRKQLWTQKTMLWRVKGERCLQPNCSGGKFFSKATI